MLALRRIARLVPSPLIACLFLLVVLTRRSTCRSILTHCSFTMYKKACIFALALVGADAFAPMPPLSPVGSSRGFSLRTGSQTVVMGTFIEEFKFRKIANRFTFKVLSFLFPLECIIIPHRTHSRMHAAMSSNLSPHFLSAIFSRLLQSASKKQE